MDSSEPIALMATSQAPWWLKPLYSFGIPAGIAVFLVRFVTQQLTADNKDQRDATARLQQTIETHAQETHDATVREVLVLEQILAIDRAICLNQSTTALERELCRREK